MAAEQPDSTESQLTLEQQEFAQSTELRITGALAQLELDRGEPLSPFHYAYLQHYWGLTAAELGDGAMLIPDDPEQIIYPYRPEATDETLELGKVLTTNWQEAREQIGKFTPSLIRLLENYSLLIPSNHATWYNLPCLAALLQDTLKDHPEGDQYRSNIHIVLGPALTTSGIGGLNFPETVQSLGTLLKTVPTTSKSHLPGFETDVKTIREDYKEEYRRVLAEPGNIVLIAPSGTRDNWLADGRIEMNHVSPRGLELLAADGAVVWPMAQIDEVFRYGSLDPGAVELFPGWFMKYQPDLHGTPEAFGRHIMNTLSIVTRGRLVYDDQLDR